MTKQQIKQLSDSELNELCHRIMGICWHETEYERFGFTRVIICLKCKQQFALDALINPNYCTNIADAWKLIEYAKESWKATRFSHRYWQFYDDGQSWVASILYRREADDDKVWIEEEANVPLPKRSV